METTYVLTVSLTEQEVSWLKTEARITELWARVDAGDATEDDVVLAETLAQQSIDSGLTNEDAYRLMVKIGATLVAE